MSKIEVLRVTDERISIKNGHIRVEIHSKTAWYDTTTNTYTGLLPDELKPALLAALLEDAGAMKVEIDDVLDRREHHSDKGRFEYLYAFTSESMFYVDDEFWLLAIREEGGE